MLAVRGDAPADRMDARNNLRENRWGHRGFVAPGAVDDVPPIQDHLAPSRASGVLLRRGGELFQRQLSTGALEEPTLGGEPRASGLNARKARIRRQPSRIEVARTRRSDQCHAGVEVRLRMATEQLLVEWVPRLF